jgi:protein-tyrosine-phosphatase
MFNILMICTGNICRSPMAEGLLRHLLPPSLEDVVQVSSAGTYALHGNQPAPHAVTTMARSGIDISGHRARMVTRELLRQADLSLVMEKAHLGALRTMRLFGKTDIRMLTSFSPGEDAPDVQDPYGGPAEMYAQSLTAIRPAVNGVIDWLLTKPELTQ